MGLKSWRQLKSQFDVFPEHMFKSKTEIILAPYEGKIIRLWLIPIKENCTIPNPYINDRQIGLPKNVEFKALESRHSERLIGQSYEQYLSNFKKNVLFDAIKLKIGIFMVIAEQESPNYFKNVSTARKLMDMTLWTLEV